MPAQICISDDYTSDDEVIQKSCSTRRQMLTDGMKDHYDVCRLQMRMNDVYDMQEDEAADHAGDIQEEPEAGEQDNAVAG